MINKQPTAKGKSVRVTFELPADAASESVAVVGDFNDWSRDQHKMKLDKKNGVWSKTVSLKPGNSYRFRYLVDESEWKNDPQADGSEPTPYASENSVIEL